MKVILTIATFAATFSLTAQIITTTLEGNNVRAHIATNGSFFQQVEETKPGYEVPKGENNHLIFANGFWFGAKSSDGSLKMCATLYGSDDASDLFRGALKDDGTADAPEEVSAGDIYVVSREEILFHATNYATFGYEAPDGIANWPAHGDVAMGIAEYLAPFADLNGNGIYEPELGEYPEIRGDHAAYLILNDRGGIHTESGGDPLGIEVHFMFYQYEDAGDLENTTFVNVRVINRSSQSYPEFIVANFLDGDIGFSEDDYMGCDSASNSIFIYNGDNFDEGTGGAVGFGENPPAVGVVSLNNAMHVGGYFERMAAPYNDPETAGDYWNYMNATWKNGMPFQYGGNGHTTGSGFPSNYMFGGQTMPDVSDEPWTESLVGNPAGDRRAFMATASMGLEAGGVRCFDYAIITSRVGDNFENAAGIIDQADEVTAFYEAQPNTYCDFTVGISELEESDLFSFYPNPSTGQITVNATGQYDLEIYSLDGRLVHTLRQLNDQSIIETSLSSGTYLLVIKQAGVVHTEKMIIK